MCLHFNRLFVFVFECLRSLQHISHVCRKYCVHTGVARIFVWVGHPADTTRPMPPSIASVVYTFEALVGSWGSVSAPAVSRIMGGAQSETNCKKK